MSATNNTTNYNLPKFIGTDKPTFLGDWNTAMELIDTKLKAIDDKASSGSSGTGTPTTPDTNTFYNNIIDKLYTFQKITSTTNFYLEKYSNNSTDVSNYTLWNNGAIDIYHNTDYSLWYINYPNIYISPSQSSSIKPVSVDCYISINLNEESFNEFFENISSGIYTNKVLLTSPLGVKYSYFKINTETKILSIRIDTSVAEILTLNINESNYDTKCVNELQYIVESVPIFNQKLRIGDNLVSYNVDNNFINSYLGYLPLELENTLPINKKYNVNEPASLEEL